MYMFWYNLLLLLASPIVLGMMLTQKRCQRAVTVRLGLSPVPLSIDSRPVVWVHAVSLGEVTAVIPFIKALKIKHSQYQVVVSTVTETGREAVIHRLGNMAQHCYAPLDFRWAVSRYIRDLHPSLFVLVESEYWPNLLKGLHEKGIPICLVNGRISSQSFRRYQRVKGFMRQVLACLTMALMQSSRDAERIRDLGAKPDGIHVTGNMKCDQIVEGDGSLPSLNLLRKDLKISTNDWVWVAGSTHPQEEESILDAYLHLIKRYGNLVLILAPRHIERARNLEKMIHRRGLSCVCRSRLAENQNDEKGHHGHRVILLDSRGELSKVYGLGNVGFVGGTLVPVGGHNVLEPAQWGRPVLFGPYVDHCQDMAKALLSGGGAVQVGNTSELMSEVAKFIDEPGTAESIGKSAFSVVQNHRGVIDKNLQWVGSLLPAENARRELNWVKGTSSSSTDEIFR